jgi:hypothetical protein
MGTVFWFTGLGQCLSYRIVTNLHSVKSVSTPVRGLLQGEWPQNWYAR